MTSISQFSLSDSVQQQGTQTSHHHRITGKYEADDDGWIMEIDMESTTTWSDTHLTDNTKLAKQLELRYLIPSY